MRGFLLPLQTDKPSKETVSAINWETSIIRAVSLPVIKLRGSCNSHVTAIISRRERDTLTRLARSRQAKDDHYGHHG